MHRMATMKRRIVYLSDEEWTRIGVIATDHGLTISAEIRGRLTHDWRPISTAIDDRYVAGIRPGEPPEHVPSPQAERDAILRKINKGE
jgi:hypothetical protein